VFLYPVEIEKLEFNAPEATNQFLLLGKRVFRTFPIHLVSVQISNNLIAKLESRLIFLYFCTYKDIFKLFGHSCIENKD